MNDEDFNGFRDLWTGAFGASGRRPPDNLAVKTAFDALAPYPLGLVSEAILAHLRDPDADGPPTPAMIARQIEGRGDARALRAWSTVEWAVRHVGAWETVDFRDPRIHATIRDMGGWPALCACDDKEWGFRKAEFVKRYRACLSGGREIDVSARAPLPGISQARNQERGIRYERVRRIENGKRAAAGRGRLLDDDVRRAAIARHVASLPSGGPSAD